MKRIAAAALVPLTACATTTAPPPVADQELEIRATVLAAYNVISGPAGRRDWDRFAALFAPGARLIHKEKVMTPDEFAKASQTYFADHGFFERPVSTRVDRYKDIAQ